MITAGRSRCPVHWSAHPVHLNKEVSQTDSMLKRQWGRKVCYELPPFPTGACLASNSMHMLCSGDLVTVVTCRVRSTAKILTHWGQRLTLGLRVMFSLSHTKVGL